MNSSSSRYTYRLFGLDFQSEVPLPGLDGQRLQQNGSTPLRIGFGPVPARLEPAELSDPLFEANEREYLLKFDAIGRIWVRNGQEIVVEPAAGADPVQLWNHIVGSGASVAGFQRGLVPLHASAVLVPGGTMAFAGQSGFGKSTLAAALGKRGFPPFSDDLCLLREEGGSMVVGAGVPEMRLLDDAVERLGLSPEQSFAVQSNVRKYVFRRGAADVEDARLCRIYSLQFVDDPSLACIERLHGVRLMQAIVDRLRMCIDPVPESLRAQAFRRIASLAQRVPVYRFARPRDHGQFDEWLDRLVNHMGEEDPQ